MIRPLVKIQKQQAALCYNYCYWYYLSKSSTILCCSAITDFTTLITVTALRTEKINCAHLSRAPPFQRGPDPRSESDNCFQSVCPVVELLPVSMAELWRVMKQSRRSSMSSRCQQLSISNSIIQAERQVRQGESPLRSAHRGAVRAILTSHQLVISGHSFSWSARGLNPEFNIYLWAEASRSALHHKSSLAFIPFDPPLGPVRSRVLSSPWQHPTNQLSSQRERARV